MIKIGEIIEDFELKDQNGNTVKLSDFSGKKVLLSFHPLAWTPVCRDQMIDLEKNFETFQELNTVALGISVDSTFCKHAWADNIGVKKTILLSDFWPHGELAKKLDVFNEEKGFSERVNIIVDENRKVIFAKHYNIPELPDISEILDFLRNYGK